MSKTIQTLREDHLNASKLLNALERQLSVFDEGRTPDYEIIKGIVDYSLDYPNLHHHPLEDRVLARLKQRDPAAVEKIGDLAQEHENLAAVTGKFAEAVDLVLAEAELPRDSIHQAARDFLDFYRKHIAKEEADFFPAALASLTAADWAEIEGQTAEKSDPVFGPDAEDRFASLREDILAWDRQG